MSTAVAVAFPQGLALPAHLQTADIAAQIAAANAAAAGGIKSSGFPKIGIEGGKFHEIEGGETRTYMSAPTAPGQPALPMMLLEVVIVAANPALIKKYYAKKWQKGDAEAPDCQSNNGVTPDAGVPSPQAAVCATCPQNQWGSKVSEATGRDVKNCSDSKQLVVLPAGDLTYKALGLAVTPAALGDWGKYVKALSDRNIPITAVATNITFDHTASFPRLQFAFSRFLTPDEFAKVQERATGDDVRNIVQPAVYVPPPAALPAPVVQSTPAAPASPPSPVVVQPITTAPAAAAPAPTGFGAGAGATTAPPAPVAEEPAKRSRKQRTVAPAATGSIDLSYLPEAIAAAIVAVGADSPAGVAMLAQFPPPVAPVTPPPVAVDPFAGQPTHVAVAVNAVGGLGSPAGDAAYRALTGKEPVVVQSAPAAPALPSVREAPAATSHVAVQAPVAATSPGFGAAPAAPVATAPSAAVTAAGGSLAEILRKKLGMPAPAAVQ